MRSSGVLQRIETALLARGFRPAPLMTGEGLLPEQIADRSYRVSPGQASSTRFRGCIETERSFQIAVRFVVPPRGDQWTIGDVLDEEDTLSLFLLELEDATAIASTYTLVDGARYVELLLSLTTRYEREGV